MSASGQPGDGLTMAEPPLDRAALIQNLQAHAAASQTFTTWVAGAEALAAEVGGAGFNIVRVTPTPAVRWLLARRPAE